MTNIIIVKVACGLTYSLKQKYFIKIQDSRLILTNCDHTQTYKLGPDLVKASGLALQGAAGRRQYLGVLLPGL